MAYAATQACDASQVAYVGLMEGEHIMGGLRAPMTCVCLGVCMVAVAYAATSSSWLEATNATAD